MILRSTKKLFQRTFQTVKSFLSGPNYQKLPKDDPIPCPRFNSYSSGGSHANVYSQASHGELDRFYADFSDRWDSGKAKKRRDKKKVEPRNLDVKKHEKLEVPSKKNDTVVHRLEGRREDHHRKTGNPDTRLEARRDHRSCLVPKKLKELEMIDLSNIDHVMDIEEILHYYSLLTCPAYLDIVDKFFMEMYAELLCATALGSSRYSTPGQWTVQGRA